MKKNQLFTLLLLFFTSVFCFSQVGIGTDKPRGALDINSPLTNNAGLVLPTNTATTNIVNPQGGSVVEGTVIFDNTEKCIKFFNGTNWSSCLCDSCDATSVDSNFQVDCTKNGFSGNYIEGAAVDGNNTFSTTVTNNTLNQIGPISFQTSDVVLSGVQGLNIYSLSHSSLYLNPGQSQLITYYLDGRPSSEGTITGRFSKLGESCSNSVEVSPTIRFGLHGSMAIGGSYTNAYHHQLLNRANYGPLGTYKTNRTFAFGVVDLSQTVEQLKRNYDIISVTASDLNGQQANIRKLQEYVALGGLLFISMDNTTYKPNQDYVFNQFGNTGNIVTDNKNFEAISSSTEILSNVFGDSREAVLLGSSYAKIDVKQLTQDAKVIAKVKDSDDVIIWTSGEGGRVIWCTDINMFVDSTIFGAIDIDQEVFIHNLMAYALEKAGI